MSPKVKKQRVIVGTAMSPKEVEKLTANAESLLNKFGIKPIPKVMKDLKKELVQAKYKSSSHKIAIRYIDKLLTAIKLGDK